MPFLSFASPEHGSNAELVQTFYAEVLNKGLLLHPRHLWFISHAHGPAEIEETLEIADAAFALTAARHGHLLRRFTTSEGRH